ncbi:coenzyme PQQ synthesis protein D (PqqD) [Nocardioides sp. J9]|uniref:PqqD family protein n=1 Tax=unclassified Nocardioides TaxID=2615069 RepID=UPI00049030AF|nr:MULTISPECIES: PqqD family protein [unclassified Nocardioides]TWG93929.1 coenzyme PQQ synthesis protein D (PqqD) [Nocardioides sp. J9]
MPKRSADQATATRWVRDDALQAVEMNGEFVMMGVDQGEYYAVKGVAATLWRHLAEPRDVDALCALVAEEYDVTPDACRADVEAFVDQLHGRGMVHPAA